MLLGRVVGTVVSTHKDEKIQDVKLLLVEKVSPDKAKGLKSHIVAMDSVGAGHGDVVLMVQGSSARMTELTTGRPCDAAIMAIVDQIDMNSKLVYNKSEDM